jgi:hypothetical protein
MPRTPESPPLSWSEIGVLAMLGGLVVLGMAANGLSLVQVLVSIGFGVGFLVLAGLWGYTLRRSPPARPLPAWRRFVNVVVVIACLALMVGLGFWWYTQREADGTPRPSWPARPEEPPPDPGQPVL